MYTIINYAIKNKGHNARLKEKEQFFSLSSIAWGKFFSLCTCTRSFLRANDTKIMRSWGAQCNAEESC